VIDAKSGMTGAGRAAKEAMLFSEVSEGFNAYGVGHHRHMAELDQEFSLAAGRPVVVTFTPHLVPMNRGIFATIYVRGRSPDDLHAILAKRYADEPFVHVLPAGQQPHTAATFGSNSVHLQATVDQDSGRILVTSAIDNLGKGAAGQAIQNANLMFGLPETSGLAVDGVAP
jgi:N-acetyl-gamma-glutamyl-phosphate reductase